jgi:hypothetical protein
MGSEGSDKVIPVVCSKAIKAAVLAAAAHISSRLFFEEGLGFGMPRKRFH